MITDTKQATEIQYLDMTVLIIKVYLCILQVFFNHKVTIIITNVCDYYSNNSQHIHVLLMLLIVNDCYKLLE